MAAREGGIFFSNLSRVFFLLLVDCQGWRSEHADAERRLLGDVCVFLRDALLARAGARRADVVAVSIAQRPARRRRGVLRHGLAGVIRTRSSEYIVVAAVR